MAIKIKLEKDGFIKDGFVGYSFTSALLDFWVPAFRLDFNGFVFFFGIYMIEKFFLEFFKIYSILNYYSINNIWSSLFLNYGVQAFSLILAPALKWTSSTFSTFFVVSFLLRAASSILNRSFFS